MIDWAGSTRCADLHAALAAVDRLQPKLNCFVAITAEYTKRGARAAEEAVMVKDVPGAQLFSLPTSHSSLFSQPGALTDLIVKNA
jgi:aspartyl-tRNA(Asn)/glutamyl-tRNA(Gln) amidotransferase subunit A